MCVCVCVFPFTAGNTNNIETVFHSAFCLLTPKWRGVMRCGMWGKWEGGSVFFFKKGVFFLFGFIERFSSSILIILSLDFFLFSISFNI